MNVETALSIMLGFLIVAGSVRPQPDSPASSASAPQLQALPTTEPVRQSQKLCRCGEYVKLKIPAFPDVSAIDMETHALQEAGFTRLSRPEAGAIVLYQGNVAGAAPEGHGEIVESVTRDGIVVSTSGYNVPAKASDAGCDNVVKVVRPWTIAKTQGVTFWRY